MKGYRVRPGTAGRSFKTRVISSYIHSDGYCRILVNCRSFPHLLRGYSFSGYDDFLSRGDRIRAVVGSICNNGMVHKFPWSQLVGSVQLLAPGVPTGTKLGCTLVPLCRSHHHFSRYYSSPSTASFHPPFSTLCYPFHHHLSGLGYCVGFGHASGCRPYLVALVSPTDSCRGETGWSGSNAVLVWVVTYLPDPRGRIKRWRQILLRRRPS